MIKEWMECQVRYGDMERRNRGMGLVIMQQNMEGGGMAGGMDIIKKV